MNIYIICPVRNVSNSQKKEIEEYIALKESEGHHVHSYRNVYQDDDTGYNIILGHLDGIRQADEVHVFWDVSSTGSHFDLGKAVALGKKLVLVKEWKDTYGKSYLKVMKEIIKNQDENKKKRLPKIYIAGKYSSKNDLKSEIQDNIYKARQSQVKLYTLGWNVFCPHQMTANFDDYTIVNPKLNYEFWMKIDQEWLAMCDAIFMLKDWENSSGSVREHEYARQHNLKIFYEIDGWPSSKEILL